MRFLYNTLALTSVLMLVLTSCGDDNGREFGDPQRPTQQFINTLDLAGTFVNDSRFTFGMIYEFQKDGQITGLCAMTPDDNDIGMDLWDLSTLTVVASADFPADSGVLTCQDITPFEVTAGSRFGVTFMTFDYYIFDDGGAVLLPANFGDVIVENYGTIFNPPLNLFPEQFFNDHISGIVDLVFEPKLD